MLEGLRLYQNVITQEQCDYIDEFFREYPYKIYDGMYGHYANGKEMPIHDVSDDNAVNWRAEYNNNRYRSESVVWKENCENKEFDNDSLSFMVSELISHYKKMDPRYTNEYVSLMKLYKDAYIMNHIDGHGFNADGTYKTADERNNIVTNVIYLNGVFTGGELVLNDTETYAPIPYSMVEFPGGLMEHKVNTITGGCRFALVSVFDYR